MTNQELVTEQLPFSVLHTVPTAWAEARDAWPNWNGIW